MTPRAIWAVGFGQLVNWGVLYYAFAVLLVPLEQALDAPRWMVAGAFSVALLVSALAAPLVGRVADAGHGPRLVRAGGFMAAVLLLTWAAMPTMFTTYVAWSGLGVCMAATLYEPVFVIVGRSFEDSTARLRAIATVTVLGGLASTVFLPVTSTLVEWWGWRNAVAALAATIAVATLAVHHVAFSGVPPSFSRIREVLTGAVTPAAPGLRGAMLTRLVSVFALSSVVNAALASNLVSALIDRQLSPTAAAAVAGMFGILQLPGRLLMTNRWFAPGPVALLLVSFSAQAAGLLALAVERSTPVLWVGVVLFAAGAGLTTLARPYLVLSVFGAAQAGAANGTIARAQHLARAGGPVAAALLASVIGYRIVFAILAVLVGGAMLLVTGGPTLSAAIPAHQRRHRNTVNED